MGTVVVILTGDELYVYVYWRIFTVVFPPMHIWLYPRYNPFTKHNHYGHSVNGRLDRRHLLCNYTRPLHGCGSIFRLPLALGLRLLQ